MSGSFQGINTALSALRYARVAMDNASQNIANVNTEGYTRRRVDTVSAGTPTKPEMYARGQEEGSGVRITGTTRMSDALLDSRVRTEHGKQSYLDLRQVVLERLETGIGEPGDNGVAAALSGFRSAWGDLANNPSSAAARSQVLARGEGVADAIRLQARGFAAEAGDQRVKLNTVVTEVNTLVGDLAATNRTINETAAGGAGADNLLDQRDQLALRISELTGARGVVNSQGGMDITLGGVPLVTGGAAGRLEVTSGVTPTGAADGAQVTFAVTTPSGARAAVGALGGEVGATRELIDTTIPAYLSGLDRVAQRLADDVNAVHTSGYDAAGAPGSPFFGYTAGRPGDLAGSLTVRITANASIAAAKVQGGVVDGGNADALSEVTGADSAYQELVNGFGSTVASSRRLTATQQALTNQVDGSREQLAGVDLDEEMTNLVQFQHAYEAAARVLTTIDSVLDTLINRTGAR